MSQTATPLPTIEPQLTPRPIDPGVRIGHVHLKVADLDRALAFYCGVLGFELKQRFGREAAFLAAGGYHLTSGSIPGRAKAAPRRLPARRASTMSRSSIPRAPPWPTP